MMAEGHAVGAVQVALRIRPLMQQEKNQGFKNIIDLVPGRPQVQIKNIPFNFNYVFPEHITHQEFYDTAVKDHIGKLFDGYNVTILAYGHTGSGKTYTMGTNYSGSDVDSTKSGVIPQAVEDIFNKIKTHKDEYISTIYVSYLELYQEICYDLLSGKERSQSIIDIREDVNKEIVLPGITEVLVKSKKDTMLLLERGSAGRVTACTSMNQTSSRSHAVFTITICKMSRSDKTLTTKSKFRLVDLAGSERAKKAMTKGERMREGVNINKGLLALGNVISALGDVNNRGYINYRDSKLTRLLQDSLGGNSLTLMVACVSPADYNVNETVYTLKYANRAQSIRNKPIINLHANEEDVQELNQLGNEPTDYQQMCVQLQEELEQERFKYEQLHQKHAELTRYVNKMVITHSNICEKVILMEQQQETFELKLNELTEQCKLTLENVNRTDKQHLKKTLIDYLKDVGMKLEDLQSLNLNSKKELVDHEIRLSLASEFDTKKVDDEISLNEDQAVPEEEKRAMGQVADQSVQELNRVMVVRASIVQAILHSDRNTLEGRENLRENEIIKTSLEKERDELMLQLKQAKAAAMKQMRGENKKSRKQLAENERALIRQHNEDRKLAIAMAKKESLHAKQQNVLRRKMEQAVAVNKRLKEALEHTKISQKKSNTVGSVNVRPVQQQIEEALELHLSLAAAEKILEELIEARSRAAEHLNDLREQERLGAPSGEDIKRLEDGIAYRNEEISDFQQKILTVDQEYKSRPNWDSIIHSMAEAKAALKYLFGFLLDTKRELQSEHKKYEEMKEAYDRLNVELDKSKAEYDRQLTTHMWGNEQKKREELLSRLRASGSAKKKLFQENDDSVVVDLTEDD